MKKLLVLGLLCLSCKGAPAALQSFEGEDGRIGFRDEKGTVRIAPTFHIASEFSPEGLAWVAADDGLFWIDRDGKRLARAFSYDNGADPFVEGRARIVEDGRMGFIDEKGRIVVEPRFVFLEPLENGRARFCEACTRVQDGEHARYEGGRWGLVDGDGRIVEAAR